MVDLTKTQRCRIDPCPMCQDRMTQLAAADRLAKAARKVTAHRSKRCYSLVASKFLEELATAVDEFSDLVITGGT